MRRKGRDGRRIRNGWEEKGETLAVVGKRVLLVGEERLRLGRKRGVLGRKRRDERRVRNGFEEGRHERRFRSKWGEIFNSWGGKIRVGEEERRVGEDGERWEKS